MGQGAVDRLRARGIAAVVSAHGAAEEAVRAYVRGELKESLTGTHDHEQHRHGGCHDHSHGGHARGCGHAHRAGRGRGCCDCGPHYRRCGRPF